ncbi:MAG: hypothetical protein EPO28_09350 [Saprospiraceae bacterium]|nr:MAG: hypothetical protein EPO28_09350 [Saprospiraceae bacterium]
MIKKRHLLWMIVMIVMTFLLTWIGAWWFHRQHFQGFELRLTAIETTLGKTNIDSLTTDDVKIEALRNELHKTDQELRKDFNVFIWGIPVTLIGIIGLFFSAYRAALEYAEENLKGEEALLRESTRIAILPANSTFAAVHLKKLGFTKRILTDVSKVKKEDNVDVYFMDNEGGTLTEDDVKAVVKSMPEKAVLVTFKLNIPRDVDNPNTSAANFRSQIYGNLMSAIRYQKML